MIAAFDPQLNSDSQIPGDPQVYFELVNGRTEQTNKDATFRAVINDKNQNQVKEQTN